MNDNARVKRLYAGSESPVSPRNEMETLEWLVELGICEFAIYYETFDALMDEGTGLSWEDYIL